MKENRNELEQNNRYTTDELKELLKTALISKNDNSYLGIPVYKINCNDTLPGEIFKTFPKNNKIAKAKMREYLENGYLDDIRIEVSNLGRIKVNNVIKEQFQKNYGWLFVELIEKIEYEVYRLVAETWVQCPVTDTSLNNDDKNYWTVHHINNNGFDNRPHNLIWVTMKEHNCIDPEPWKRTNILIKSLLIKLEYYVELHTIDAYVIEIIEDLCLLCSETNSELKCVLIRMINELGINKEYYTYIKWNNLN